MSSTHVRNQCRRSHLFVMAGTLTAAATLLAGCTVPRPPRFADDPKVESAIGNYAVYYRLPEPLPLNEPFALEAWVEPALDDAQLIVDAGMPHHHHGMNQQPTIARLADGSFAVDGMLFHMPGYWEIYFDVTRGPVTERAQISVELE